MIQDRVGFKSKWVPTEGDRKEISTGTRNGGMRFSIVFITGSNQHMCVLRAVIPN